MPRRSLPLPAVVLAAAALLPGCADLGYYAQSIRGQAALLARREPIPRLLHAADTPPALKARLARVLEIRAFAGRELALPDNASYRSYVAVDRPYLTWVVFAAPALSLKPVRWCYPIVGCAVYRGYFHRSAATAFAARLRRDGDDVYVGGVPAYSTLGWFADPLPSTVIDWPVPELAGLIFHELAHQELFVPGDSRFDESFAVAVQEAGVRRWLQTHGTPAARAAWCAARRRQTAFRALIDAARARLAAVYAGARPNAAKRVIKERIFARLTRDYRALKRSWGGYAGYDRWFEGGMNNAKLVALQTYDEYVPAFRRLLAAAHGDFPAFYATARALAKLPKARRDTVLAALAEQARPKQCRTDRRRRPVGLVGRGLPRRRRLIQTTSGQATTSAGQARPYPTSNGDPGPP